MNRFLFSFVSKIKYLTGILFLVSFSASYSQMTISKMINLPFDENYKLHEKSLKSNFETSPRFWKGDFNGAFYLQYEDVEFDNYGSADIEFHYIQNKLVSAEVKLKIYKERFGQIKSLHTLFETEITTKYKVYPDDEVLGNINATIAEVNKCSEKGRFDYSQNKTLYSKAWYFDNPIKKTSKLVTTGIYINGDGLVSCRVLMEFEFTKLDLTILEMKSNSGMRYIAMDEYVKKEIKLKEVNGIYRLPVKLNNNLTLDFVLDLGATDVSISQDVFSVLVKAGSIDQSDFVGEKNYQLADGKVITSKVFNLRSLKVGEFEINNVRASISSTPNAPLLLGQSALKKLGKYQIDNSKMILLIE